MPPQAFDIKRRWALLVILCLSCVLAVSCKTAPNRAQDNTAEPQGSGLGRAEAEPTPPEHDVDHPPTEKGYGVERVQKKADSTPTPTPNRDIDRPLDPVGRPFTSPSPSG